MNIGIMASAQGSVFKELYNFLKNKNIQKFTFFVILDRKTTLYDFAMLNDISVVLLNEPNKEVFCNLANKYFYENKIDIVVLFFLRIITNTIYDNYPTFNIHPSLLPAHKGLNPIKQCIDDNCKFIGATLHKVNEELDGGKILIQIIKLISEPENLILLNKISFLQKSAILFVLFDYIYHDKYNDCFIDIKFSNTLNPYFYSRLFEQGFKDIESKENIKICDV